MHKGRLEAFSDGVFAIIITIMVLELKVPHGETMADLLPLLPVFISYVLSFVYVGIYWNNHHHLLQAAQRVNGKILWANLLLLFWLSLVPFASGWMGENHFAPLPVALYGIVLLGAAFSYYGLTLSLIGHHGKESAIGRAVGEDKKGKVSLLIYILAVASTWVSAWIGFSLYCLVAIVWLIPDSRIEKSLSSRS